MMLKAILCVQHLIYFCSFAALLFIEKLLVKTNFTIICVLCMLEHVCYESFSFENCRFVRYFMLIG